MSSAKPSQQLVERILKADDFIKYLWMANAGALNLGNIWCFDYAVSHLSSSAPIVEIGSFCGLSANIITYLKLKYGVHNRLICSEPWNFEEDEINPYLSHHPYIKKTAYKQFIKASFIQNTRFFSSHDLPFAIELTSDNFFAAWEQEKSLQDVFSRQIQLGGSISFAYIDGNHAYEFAWRDFQNVDRFLEVGGFILFDDSADGSDWEVCQVVAEVASNPRYEIVKKNPNYFFKKINNN
jgi:hypothetical protein